MLTNPIMLLDRARAAVRIAQSCRSRELRARHAAAARDYVDTAARGGADVADVAADLERIETELAQGVLFAREGGAQ